MRDIKPVVYESLTTRQRVIATIEAEARGDDDEKNRLIKTCPKKTYAMSDHAYAGKMEALQDIAMVVECDMRGHALNFFMLLYLEDNFDHDMHEKLREYIDRAPCQIQEMLSIKQAWHEILGEEGISPALMDKVYKPIMHYAIEWASVVADYLDLEADPETVRRYKDIVKKYLARVME